MSHLISKNQKPIIFRSYIGVKQYPETLNDFPTKIIDEDVVEQFHFILGFAKETHDGDEYGTGLFDVKWNTHFFSKEKVVSLKKNHPSVKVILSIGGNDHPFNTSDKDDWVRNAVKSIKAILEDYRVDDPCGCEPSHYTIDGIDINYQSINPNVTPADFSYCIGSVIQKLTAACDVDNHDMNVKVVSIAPSDSVNSYYKQLYSDYQSSIHWVDYQFYHQKVQQTKDFVELFGSITDDYDRYVVLAGGSSDKDNKDNVPQKIFLDGCKQLINEGRLPGIFIWNAHDSDILRANERYNLELKAQELFPSKH